ncbi:hypothetical protein ACHAWF_004732, partial [Thalassiosira exigua]
PAVPAAALSSAAAPAAPVVPRSTRDAIRGLEPPALWDHFAALSSIPRPSGKEKAASDYVKGVADARGLPWREDAAGNLAVFRPGSGSGASAPPVVVQGHLDMVTEKNDDSDHDFDADPISLRRFVVGGSGDGGHEEGGEAEEETWIGARGTTLGADNGIGVAATLALLELDPNDDGSASLPPIQALFTVEEETGLHGAAKLDVRTLGLTGKTVLNLDMEEWGGLFVGCAGGGDTTIDLLLKRDATFAAGEDAERVEIRVDGLMGGHSGLNIHEGRGNAVLLCAAAARGAIDAVVEAGGRASIASIRGGDKHNAIPRGASAVVVVSGGDAARDAAEASVRAAAQAARDEFGLLETGLRMQMKRVEACNDARSPLDEESTSRLLSCLLALPHGPLKYSHALPGLVETSNNVASVRLTDDGDRAEILCSSRSSIGSALEGARDKVAAVALLAGGTARRSKAYPGWAPDPASTILDVSKRLLRERAGREASVNAVHAGLECGLLIEKLGGDVDAISFGPTIEGAHSPDERVLIDTVPPFFELVKDILTQYAIAGKDRYQST